MGIGVGLGSFWCGIMVVLDAHNDIDFGIRNLESLGLSFCLS